MTGEAIRALENLKVVYDARLKIAEGARREAIDAEYQPLAQRLFASEEMTHAG